MLVEGINLHGVVVIVLGLPATPRRPAARRGVGTVGADDRQPDDVR